MLQAYLSYSLSDADDILSFKLRDKLWEQEFSTTNSGYTESELNELDAHAIALSSLFIGVLSSFNERNQKVYNEWKYAIECKIPSILLVEDSLDIQEFDLSLSPNVIRFNRNSPKKAIKLVKKKIEDSTPKKTSSFIDSIAWVMGGLAVVNLLNGFLLRASKPS